MLFKLVTCLNYIVSFNLSNITLSYWRRKEDILKLSLAKVYLLSMGCTRIMLRESTAKFPPHRQDSLLLAVSNNLPTDIVSYRMTIQQGVRKLEKKTHSYLMCHDFYSKMFFLNKWQHIILYKIWLHMIKWLSASVNACLNPKANCWSGEFKYLLRQCHNLE